MPVPTVLKFAHLSANYFEWGPIVDGLTANSATPNYINDLNVVAALYANRNSRNPQQNPGTKILEFGDGGSIVLPFVPSSNGLYRAVVGPFPDVVLGDFYTMEIDATDATYKEHWEVPVIIVV